MRLNMRALLAGASLLCLLAGPALAQTFDDALRLSELGTFGTARSLATGNSMGAIGAEWTAVQSNPAGLAAFRRNELSLTIGGIAAGTDAGRYQTFTGVEESSLTNSTASDSDFRLVLPQAAAVFTRKPIGSRWTQFNFGIGVSQTRRQEENISFAASAPGSITDRFLETSNNFYAGDPFPPDQLLPFDELLALETGAIFELGEDDRTDFERYASDYDDLGRDSDTDPGIAFPKSGNVQRRGYNASVDLSFGANYDEKLLVGATLGLVNHSFEESNVYREIDSENQIQFFDQLTWIQATNSSGTGVLGRIGAIYRANQALRVGLSFHTPTLTFVDQSYSTQLTYRFTEGTETNEATAASPAAEQVEYRFRSPAQLRASAGVVIGRRGFVSAEIARINYAGGRFTIDEEFDPGEAFSDELNDIIDANLRANYQFRLGGEVNLSPVQLRAGYEFTGTPLESFDGVTEDPTQRFSAGIGWRPGRFGLDLAYQHTRSADRVYRPYTTEIIEFPSPEVVYTPTLNTFALSLTYKLGRR